MAMGFDRLFVLGRRVVSRNESCLSRNETVRGSDPGIRPWDPTPDLLMLTKSLFTAGLQCPRLLWWKVHEPEAVELQPDKVLQDSFDQGAQVGALARELFDGGTLIGHFEPAEVRIAQTQAAVAERRPIFEGTFT